MILRRTLFAFAAVLVTGAPALAATQPAPPDPTTLEVQDTTSAEARGEVLNLGELEAVTGGDVKAEGLSHQELSATNTGNTIGGSVQSGDVTFSQDALSGFTGVGNFVINTGANNNLQGAISINIVTAGP